MTDEWKDCPTIEDVVEAKKRGDEIEVQTDPGNDKYCPWKPWIGKTWCSAYLYRCRPAKPKTKTITLRKALLKTPFDTYWTVEGTCEYEKIVNFVCWLGEPHTMEVPE